MDSGERDTDKFNHSVRMNGFSGDLLHKFMKRSHEEEDEEIELSLGLSMNGRFGVDPLGKKLKRSSSISNLVFTVGAADNGGARQARPAEFDGYAPPLVRARSLPTEAEEEWRRQKEFQSMRRMEARRKRMEKLRNVRVLKEKDFFEDVKSGTGSHEVINGDVHGERLENGILIKSENGNEISSSQGSIGSQRSGSSGISDVEFRPKEGEQQNAEAEAEAPPSGDQELASKAAKDGDRKSGNRSLKNDMLDMPYVSTKGDGSQGQRVEGFLYRYKKGEEVRILCVCHGHFLTPAEFVKHGGGDDVEHPLKHILVYPFPLL